MKYQVAIIGGGPAYLPLPFRRGRQLMPVG